MSQPDQAISILFFLNITKTSAIKIFEEISKKELYTTIVRWYHFKFFKPLSWAFKKAHTYANDTHENGDIFFCYAPITH
jgi:hypothetical protein